LFVEQNPFDDGLVAVAKAGILNPLFSLVRVVKIVDSGAEGVTLFVIM
jgi:hypothetical protein